MKGGFAQLMNVGILSSFTRIAVNDSSEVGSAMIKYPALRINLSSLDLVERQISGILKCAIPPI